LGSWVGNGHFHGQGFEKEVVGLVCPIDKTSDELSLTSVEKGFQIKELKEKIAHVIIGMNYLKLFQLRKMNCQKTPRGPLNGLWLTLRAQASHAQQKNHKRKNQGIEKKDFLDKVR
jgi:hypothetical protein